MKIIFMGTPDFAVSALQAICNAGHEVVAVYTQPPRKANRGKKESKTPVHQFADSKNLPVKYPVNFKDEKDIEEFAKLDADIAVVVAYGLLLPKALLDAPNHGALNIHASLLPRWRGAAPIQRAIMAGDEKTGVNVIQMDEGLDSGDVLAGKEVLIDDEMNAGQLHDILAKEGAELIVEVLKNINSLNPKKQPKEGIYASKLKKEEAKIDWQQDAVVVDRQIRGLTPWPGVWFEHNGQRIKIIKAKVENSKGKPGLVLDDNLLIACGKGAVRPLFLQRQGKQVMELSEFLRGYPIKSGSVLT